MGYIIVWRNSHKNPHVDKGSNGLKEEFSSYEDAKKSADDMVVNRGPACPWFFDYAIYEEVTS
jgi:hypothetical protein